MRILIIEDEPRISASLAKGLREQAFAVDLAPDGETGLELAFINRYDGIILDVLLPGKNGFMVCRELREHGNAVPILMLTARGTVDDRVAGLNFGADDYLVKPFEFRELVARIQALLRRSQTIRPPQIQAGDLSIDTISHQVVRAGRAIHLTAREFALLEFMVLNQDTVLSRGEIASHVWDENFDPFSNVIEVFIRRLRKKVDVGFSAPLIHTRRGEGYVFSAGNELGP